MKRRKGSKINKNNLIFIIIICFVFVTVFVLNHFTVFTSDDFSLLYDYKGTDYTPGITRISSLSQIVESMKNLYLYVNGRIFPHAVLQFLLMFPKVIFNIFNSIMFVLFGLLIYKISINNKSFFKEFKPFTLILIYILMYLLFPTFGMTVLWCSGSLNYLWHTFFVLLYFWYLIRFVNIKKKTCINYVLVFILSLIAGNGPENISIAALFFTIMVTLLDIIKNKKFNLWMLLPLLGNILGIYTLFTAGALSERGLTDDAFTLYRIFNMIKIIIQEHTFSLISILVSFGLFMFIDYKKKNYANHMYLYSLTALFSFTPLFVSPYISGRMFFLSASIVIILIIYLYNMLNSCLIKKIILFILFALWLYTYIFVCFKDVKKSYDVYIDIENIILESKNNGNSSVYIPYYYREYSDYTAFSNKYTFPSTYKNFWINEWLAFYYGVDYVTLDDSNTLESLYD